MKGHFKLKNKTLVLLYLSIHKGYFKTKKIWFIPTKSGNIFPVNHFKFHSLAIPQGKYFI